MARVSEIKVEKADIDPFDESRSFESYYRPGYEYTAVKNKTAFQRFNLKFREFNQVATGLFIEPAEAWLMVNRVTGYTSATIPYCKIDQAIEWIKKYSHRRIYYLDNKMFGHIMSGQGTGFDEYREWYREREAAV
jgi:hypothetical protein